jgi:hypothetical protein
MGIPESYVPEGLSRTGMRRRKIVRRNPKHYIFKPSTAKRQNSKSVDANLTRINIVESKINFGK